MSGRHHGGEASRDVEAGRVANPCGGGVLTGEDSSGVDCLALCVDKRGLSQGCLRRGKPLEGGGGRGGGVSNEDGRGGIRKGDGESGTKGCVRR